MLCNLCPRHCNSERTDLSGNGFCQSGFLPKVAKIAPFYWEEPCISGDRGSGAIFFSGCTLKCVFCQNYEISAMHHGKYISVRQLADSYKSLENAGVHNINLISGSHFIDAIKNSLLLYKPKIPVVFNCGGYEDLESLKKLEGLVDIYMPDFKYSDDRLAQWYSHAPGYTTIAVRAIEEMIRQTGKPVLNQSHMLTKGVLVRHLILPNHTKNSIGVLDILKEKFGGQILVSLMGQYIPHGKAKEFPKLSRKITKREYDKVAAHLLDLNLDGFMQELTAADEKYIPDWDE